MNGRQLMFGRHVIVLMVIHDLNVIRIAIKPYEANPSLVVDADAVLTGAISLQRFEAVAGKYSQVVQVAGLIEQPQFALRHPLEPPKLPDPRPLREQCRIPAPERPYHDHSV